MLEQHPGCQNDSLKSESSSFNAAYFKDNQSTNKLLPVKELVDKETEYVLTDSLRYETEDLKSNKPPRRNLTAVSRSRNDYESNLPLKGISDIPDLCSTSKKRDFWTVVLGYSLNTTPSISEEYRGFQDARSSHSTSDSAEHLLCECPWARVRTAGRKRIRNTREQPTGKQNRVKNQSLARPEFACTECCSVFKRKYDLVQHVSAVHKKMRPYRCSVCQSSFAHKGTLSKHHRTVHLGEKPFSCRFKNCGLKFSEKGNLNKHVARIHSNHS